MDTKLVFPVASATYLFHWFNELISEYGQVSVGDLNEQILLKPVLNLSDFKRGWTKKISFDKMFETEIKRNGIICILNLPEPIEL